METTPTNLDGLLSILDLAGTVVIVIAFLRYLAQYQTQLAKRHDLYFKQLQDMTSGVSDALTKNALATAKLYMLVDHMHDEVIGRTRPKEEGL